MTQDHDKALQETIDRFEDLARGGPIALGARDLLALARALADTRRELAETRRLVDALIGPMQIEGGVVTWQSLDGKERWTARQDPWPEPLDEAHYALHELWSEAVGQPSYDKEKWMRLEGAIGALRKERARPPP